MKRIVLFLLILSAAGVVTGGQQCAVTYVRIGGMQLSEDATAVSWLKSNAAVSATEISAAEASKKLDPASIVWMHVVDSTDLQKILANKPLLSSLRAHYDRGGKILCTDYAAFLPYYLGIESKKPEIRSDSIQNDWLFDKRGYQGFRGHPLFAGLNGGEYVWDPDENQVLPFVGYFGNEFPEKGKVVAVDKAYVFVYMQRRIVIEYGGVTPRCIAVGSSVYFSRRNNLRANLEIFIENAFQYLGGRQFEERATFWQQFKNVPKEIAVRTAAVHPSKGGDFSMLPASELALYRENAKTEFFDVAGRRALVMGKENGGIDEIWIHPFRVVRDYQAGILSGDTVAWLNQFPVNVNVRPESFTRTYTLPGGMLREVVFASLQRAGAVVHYEYASQEPLAIVIRLRSDARWMWPYDANTLGDLHYGYDDGLKALHVTDTGSAMYALFGADAAPRAQLSGQFESIRWSGNGFRGTPTLLNQVYHAASFELNRANNYSLNYVVVGGSEGRARSLEDYRVLVEQPSAAYREQVHHYDELLKNSLQIASPNKEFDELFKWSIVGTDRFVANTPGIGEGLLAGFSTTARGWNGEHKNSGRPGYAWYFGRDAVWSGYAIDDYGDFELVKKQLLLFQKFQDPSGKILHEMSTSGVVHYDAADATPLYLTLAGHYLRASGDAAFIRQLWPSLKKSMDFLYATDTDHDGYIENTNQGHGWVEGGALFGAHSALYLNAAWVQALRDMSAIALMMGNKDLSRQYGADGERVRTNINTQFWNDSTQFFNFGMLANRTFQTEPTVLPAVGAYWNVYDEAKAKPMLNAYAGNGFTTNWGVRILSSSSRLCNPGGYHYGSVWPLFTGWAALAEYEYGNSTQGFAHIWDNIYIKKHWALGFVQEVMSGAVYKPSGICPHQCWSETNVLHPAITGMIGWKPDAMNMAAAIRPRFPLSWDSVTVTNLRVGRSTLRLSLQRTLTSTYYRLDLLTGPAVTIHFQPEIPAGMTIQKAFIDGKEIHINSVLVRGILAEPITMNISSHTDVTLQHTGGVGMVPLIMTPQPGDSALGARIITSSLEGKKYTVTVEGVAGTETLFPVMIFDQPIPSADGGVIEKSAVPGQTGVRIRFEGSNGGVIRRTFSLSW